MSCLTRKLAWLFIGFALAGITLCRADMDDDGINDDGFDDDTGIGALARPKCGKTNRRVGLVATIVDGVSKNVGGSVVIDDDCTFYLRGFSYDGTGSDVVIVGGASVDDLREGIIFKTLADGEVWDGTETIRLKLEGGLTWDDVNIISVWSRALTKDLGSADLTKGAIRDADDDDGFGDDDGDIDDDGIFDDDGDIDDDGVLDDDDGDFDKDGAPDDDDGDVDDDGIADDLDEDFVDNFDDDDGDVDDDGIADDLDEDFVDDFDDDDGDVDDDGVLDEDDDLFDDDGDIDDDGVLDDDDGLIDDDGDIDDDGILDDDDGLVDDDGDVDDDGVFDDDGKAGGAITTKPITPIAGDDDGFDGDTDDDLDDRR